MIEPIQGFSNRMRVLARQQNRQIAEDLGLPITPELMTDEELDEHISKNNAARNDKTL